MTTLGCDWMLALQAPKGVIERVKSPYRNTSMYTELWPSHKQYTHTLSSPIRVARARWCTFLYSAKYNRTERLLHLFDGSGLLHTICIRITLCYMLCYASRRHSPTRLETRTKEFNWIASRRVHFSQCSHHTRRSESKIVRSKTNHFTAVQADYV